MVNFNYSLEKNDYSLKNALLWGNCYGHYKRATTGRLGHRIAHILLALLELPPLISQIASVFEMIIITKFDQSNNFIEDLTNKKISFQKANALALVNFKKKVISALPEHIKNQEEHPSYKRPKLIPLDDEKLNTPIVLTVAPEGIEHFASKSTFYGYNSEGIRDYRWGCAWRSIQTCLSAYDVKVSFEEMFHLFGNTKNMDFLFSNKYSGEKLNSAAPYAPYDLKSGWAEPFIGQMAMHFYGLSAKLERVNGFPKFHYAPRPAFRNKFLTFQTFKERIESHFKKENAAPIMIDDGAYASTIVGIGCHASETKLWIADPHIDEGVNRVLTEQTPVGLYTVTLDEAGKQIDCSLNHEDVHQVANLYCPGSYKGLHFNKKKWMVLFPQ